VSGLGSRYAKALISILGDMSPDDILPQLEACRDALSENVDLRRAFESPAITPQEKDGMLSALGRDGKLDEIVVRFLSLLVRQRRLKNLPEMVDAFREIRDERLDVSRVTVRSARPSIPTCSRRSRRASRRYSAATSRWRRTSPPISWAAFKFSSVPRCLTDPLQGPSEPCPVPL